MWTTKCTILFSPNALKCICCCTQRTLVYSARQLHSYSWVTWKRQRDRHVVKLLFIFFQVKKQTEQRYREWDNELISIQWQFQVKPSFAQTCVVFPQFETLSRPPTHANRTHIHTFIPPGSPDVLNWLDSTQLRQQD